VARRVHFGCNFKSEQGSYQQLHRDMLRSPLDGLVAIPQVAQSVTVQIPLADQSRTVGSSAGCLPAHGGDEDH
jgi:hypothetical protein